jgi:putative endonuclease
MPSQHLYAISCFSTNGSLLRKLEIQCNGNFPNTVTPAKAGAGLWSQHGTDYDPRMERSEKLPAVYILANRYRGKLYVGVTSALYLRVCDHKNETFDGFTKEHQVKTLVWYAHFHSMEDAIHREKLLKKWHREWKFRLIESVNADWLDLHNDIDANIFYEETEAPPRPSPG